MTKTFLKTGNTIRVRDNTAIRAYSDLPAETYTVKFDERAGEFFLEQIDNFTLPSKIYGMNNNYAARILTTFACRPGSTGVLLSGIKGAGKTLLAKQTSVAARAEGIPTIVINRDWHGDEFNSFIQSITTQAIVMFDEFEKIYDYAAQRKILTLFDGVFPSRKLFMITSNTDRDISEFMQNRPGRIFYNFEFDTLEQAFIEEFLEDRLDDKSQIPDILKYTSVFSFFNFDMLNAAVEEMNRYKETLAEVLKVLNIRPENRNTDSFTIELVLDGKSFVLDRTYNGFQPNSFDYFVWADSDMPDKISDDAVANKALVAVASDNVNANDHDRVSFNPTHITGFDQAAHRFSYEIASGEHTAQLFVTRNDPVIKWTYDSRAF